MSDTLDIEVTNKFTGEIFTVTVNPYELGSLIDALVQVQDQRKALDSLEKDLKEIIEKDHLEPNQYEPMVANGFEARWVTPARKSYDISAVMSHIDQDLLISNKAISVSNSNLEKLMAKMVANKELDTEDSRPILDSVLIKYTKPYVKLLEVK